MSIPLPNPLFDVGFELELFLTQENRVYNAAKVMTEAMGFSIDQNQPSSGSLDLADGYKLRTDGTALELHWFKEHCMLPSDFQERLCRVKAIGGYNRTYLPYIHEGEMNTLVYFHPTVFHEPGTVYGSGKLVTNAYTGVSRNGYKDKGDNKVTERTAGLHLHFSVARNAARWCYGAEMEARKKVEDKIDGLVFEPHHSNELIKLMDRIYAGVLTNNGCACRSYAAATKAREKYQPMGDYRVKANDTVTGHRTLEYRQFDAGIVYQWHLLQRAIDTFQFAAAEYLRPLV